MNINNILIDNYTPLEKAFTLPVFAENRGERFSKYS